MNEGSVKLQPGKDERPPAGAPERDRGEHRKNDEVGGEQTIFLVAEARAMELHRRH